MATITLTLKQLGQELRAIPKRDREAIIEAARETAAVDAQRWIQWSIRGGGRSGMPGRTSTRTSTPSKKRKRRKKTQKVAPAYRAPIDTGDYANSWTHQKIENGAVFYSASNPRVKAGVIELGRRPGKGIPIEPLVSWVRRKLGESDPQKARGIAIAISKKAKREGRPGLFVLKRAHPKIAAAYKKNVVKRLKQSGSKAAKMVEVI